MQHMLRLDLSWQEILKVDKRGLTATEMAHRILLDISSDVCCHA